jgi:hypothetical protein
VRAGLLPHLRRRQEGHPVSEIVTMVPRGASAAATAAALVPLLEPGMDEIQQLGNVNNFFDPTDRYCDQRD